MPKKIYLIVQVFSDNAEIYDSNIVGWFHDYKEATTAFDFICDNVEHKRYPFVDTGIVSLHMYKMTESLYGSKEMARYHNFVTQFDDNLEKSV